MTGGNELPILLETVARSMLRFDAKEQELLDWLRPQLRCSFRRALLESSLQRGVYMALKMSRLSSSMGITFLLACFSTAVGGQQPAEIITPPGAGAADDRAVQLVGRV